MNVEEFLKPRDDQSSLEVKDGITAAEETVEKTVAEAETDQTATQLAVQTKVVEDLAIEKARQEETISDLQKQINSLQEEIARLKSRIAEQNVALGKVGETLAANMECPLSNQISLLDRHQELPDRFEGETRDHIIEVLAEARDAAEKEGRIRRAQILEGVLVANESSGKLAEKREELKKLFAKNANIVSGPVIDALKNLGISHKNGEEYLLPNEIIKRTY